MQGLILAEHEHQCSLHLFHRHRNRSIPESLTEVARSKPPPLPVCVPPLRFLAVSYPRGLHAPRMFLICPVDTHQRRKLGFPPQNFAF